MSLFNRRGIPESLLRDRYRSDEVKVAFPGKDDKDKVVDDSFKEDVLALRDCSFISVGGARPSFELHALV